MVLDFCENLVARPLHNGSGAQEATMSKVIDYRGYVIAVSARLADEEGWVGRYTITIKDTGQQVHEMDPAVQRRSLESACNAAVIHATDYVDGQLGQAKE